MRTSDSISLHTSTRFCHLAHVISLRLWLSACRAAQAAIRPSRMCMRHIFENIATVAAGSPARPTYWAWPYFDHRRNSCNSHRSQAPPRRHTTVPPIPSITSLWELASSIVAGCHWQGQRAKSPLSCSSSLPESKPAVPATAGRPSAARCAWCVGGRDVELRVRASVGSVFMLYAVGTNRGTERRRA